jgi:hypothetical protein
MHPCIRAVPVILAAVACSSETPPGPLGPGDPHPPFAALEGDLLFIGNSLTEYNDLPAIVQVLAESAGTPGLRTAAIVAGGAALEDHWRSTLTLETIAQGNWRFVVLQQGPSSLPESRADLREWTARFAERVRAAGGEPALYTVWPEESRFDVFDAVIESYRLAAEDVGGVELPAGAAWLRAWELDATVQLYGPDRFHPSLEGSYLAALVIYGGLSGRSPVGLPASFRLPSGLVRHIPAATAAILQQAAEQALADRSAPLSQRLRSWVPVPAVAGNAGAFGWD